MAVALRKKTSANHISNARALLATVRRRSAAFDASSPIAIRAESSDLQRCSTKARAPA
jgi:hypothetical protein